MAVTRLDINSVRNISEATIYPGPTLNFIYGDNASGKSTLLEALFLLGRARSFRANSIRSVIQFTREHLLVAGSTQLTGGVEHQLGVKLDSKSCIIRINRQTMPNKSSLAYALPLQLIYPKSYELLDGGPQLRREFLDWGVFHHEPGFLPAWRNYKIALSQRNALLKTRNSDHLQVWSRELAHYGTIVNDLRQHYVRLLLPIFQEFAKRLLALEDFLLSVNAGWDATRELLDVLNEEVDRDLRDGFTHSGPHRADVAISLRQNVARDIVSRGQLKLLVISLKLAQVQLLHSTGQQRSCILFDDISAELDAFNRNKVLRIIRDMQCQAFITAISPNDFGNLSNCEDYKMFHVEHGRISAENVPCGT